MSTTDSDSDTKPIENLLSPEHLETLDWLRNIALLAGEYLAVLDDGEVDHALQRPMLMLWYESELRRRYPLAVAEGEDDAE